MKKILVATDGSEASAQAVAVAVELAADHAAEVVFVHVTPALDVIPWSGLGSTVAAFPHELTHTDVEPLEAAAAVAAEHDIPATTTLVRSNAPVEEIVAQADQVDADLIVVGSRGHGAAASVLLGSVSRALLDKTRRPLLIVHARAVPAASASPVHPRLARPA
jgi:nucleotide-binding universal stress UspA family protein